MRLSTTYKTNRTLFAESGYDQQQRINLGSCPCRGSAYRAKENYNPGQYMCTGIYF